MQTPKTYFFPSCSTSYFFFDNGVKSYLNLNINKSYSTLTYLKFDWSQLNVKFLSHSAPVIGSTVRHGVISLQASDVSKVNRYSQSL